MKKILFLLLAFLIGVAPVLAITATRTPVGIGAKLIKDPYNKKVFILSYYPESSARDAKIPVGAEILEINGQKAKKLTTEEIANIAKGEEGTSLTLYVKYNKEKKTYNVPRKPFTIPPAKKDKYSVHWKQVVPTTVYLGTIPENVMKNLSRKYRNKITSNANYWNQRKTAFNNGYDACMTYEQSEQNNCLMNLVNREINQTTQDKQLELQQYILHQQMVNNMNQMQIHNQLQNMNHKIRYYKNLYKHFKKRKKFFEVFL